MDPAKEVRGHRINTKSNIHLDGDARWTPAVPFNLVMVGGDSLAHPIELNQFHSSQVTNQCRVIILSQASEWTERDVAVIKGTFQINTKYLLLSTLVMWLEWSEA